MDKANGKIRDQKALMQEYYDESLIQLGYEVIRIFKRFHNFKLILPHTLIPSLFKHIIHYSHKKINKE